MRIRKIRQVNPNITDDMKFAVKLAGEFSKAQPKKQRRNIYAVTNKLSRQEPLSDRDKETLKEFGKFINER